MKTEDKIHLKGFRSWAEVDKDRLVHNVKSIHSRVNKDIFAVVKADAYGHGAAEVSKILQGLKSVRYLCVATAEEGRELREAGINSDVLVLGGILPEEVDIFSSYNLVPVVSDFDQLRLAINNRIKKVHLKFDTGMHRLGFYPGQLDEIIKIASGRIHIEGIMSHFPSADTDPEYTQKQITAFGKIVKQAEKYGIKPRYIHLQNSAGLEYRCDFCNSVRIGISIYGEKPSKSFSIPVKTVMSVKAKVITVKQLKKGERVSYGGTFRAPADMKIAVVAFGYADGLPRALSNRGYFLFKDRKIRIIGNVTMDMTIVDVTGLEDIKPDDTVTVIGRDREKEIYFEEVASLCNTIPYEIMCRISKRVKRVIV
ncbi:alanine racemase [Persephonella sp.]